MNLNRSVTQNFSIYYQNVQGLIPFSNLSFEHPNLDVGKILELHSYVYKSKPDIIVLNETWLKPSISNNEILPPELYNVYRCDRSASIHPPDINNPKNSSFCINYRFLYVECYKLLEIVPLVFKLIVLI